MQVRADAKVKECGSEAASVAALTFKRWRFVTVERGNEAANQDRADVYMGLGPWVYLRPKSMCANNILPQDCLTIR